ncbi:MAG: M20/M25/M40 family metallo-hydrolase [Planctomycetota bacterium]
MAQSILRRVLPSFPSLAGLLVLPLLTLPVLSPPIGAQEPAVAESAGESSAGATLTDVTPVVDEATAEAIRTEGIQRSHAMHLLRDLTSIGQRLTGSDNFTRACDWAVAEFSSMGLENVHKEKWGEWRLAWNRGEWQGRIVEPYFFPMYVATEAWTASTDGLRRGRVLQAPADELAAAALGEDLRGAFLFFDRRPPKAVREYCEQRGIAGWVSPASGQPDDKAYPTRVRVFGDHRTAMGSIDKVPTVPSIVVQQDHAERLQKLLDDGEAVVCEFQVDSEFRDGGIPLYNVIAEIPGTEKPDEVVIVCGHLDSWHQAQGCTDNGTGATSTMEAARILSAIGARPKRTIRFCLWGGEEQGLLGSGAYVKMHRTEMEKVSAVFNHDTGTNWAAALTVAETMYEPMLRVTAPMQALTAPDADHEGPTFVLRKSPTISGGGGSDHASFIAAGVPGLNWSLKGRSDYFRHTWHTQWDRLDVAIPEYQAHTSTVVALAALGTANLPELLDRSGVVQRERGRQARSYGQALFDAELDGFTFTEVTKDGRADKMGIQKGDVLTKAQGEELTAMHEIFQILRELEGEKFMELELKRGDQAVKVQLDLEDLRQRRGSGRGNRGGNRGGGSGGSSGGTGGSDGTGDGGEVVRLVLRPRGAAVA